MSRKLIILFIGLILIIGIGTLLFISSGSYQLDSETPTSTPTPSTISSNGIAPSPDRNEDTETTTVNIYLIALEDGGEMGDEIGCGDSIVPVERTVVKTEDSLEAAIRQLLLVTNRDPSSGYYNALHSSDLELISADIENGIATINLEGEIQVGGVCDNPRIQEQLKRTVLQFQEINEAVININGQSLEELLSSR